MRRLEFVLRVIAYLCGLAGMVLVVHARGNPSAGCLGEIGWMLLVAMFVLFVTTYALRIARMTRRRTPRTKR